MNARHDHPATDTFAEAGAPTRVRSRRARVAALLAGVVTMMGITAPTTVAAPGRTAPAAVASTGVTASLAATPDPLVARGCLVPVMTRGTDGVTTFTLLGVPGGPMTASLGRITAGARLAAAGGMRRTGDPARSTVLRTGVIVTTRTSQVAYRAVTITGNHHRAVVGRPAFHALASSSDARLLASSWVPKAGGSHLFVSPAGELFGYDARSADPTATTDMASTFRRSYADLRAIAFTGPASSRQFYAVTNAGALVRLRDARAGEGRVTLNPRWRGMSKPVFATQCTRTRAGEWIFIAADRAGTFRVYSVHRDTLRLLGVTSGRSTGEVL